jgi:hypothetical protein
MSNEKKANGNALYSLISLEEFKTILSIDDREEKIARFCLVTATFTIEQFCRRRLLRKKYFEIVEYYGEKLLPLSEYPVSNVLAAYAMTGNNGTGELSSYRVLIEPDLYYLFPNAGIVLDIPYSLSISPALQRYRGLKAIKAVYWAGYADGNVPADLSAACMELATWNLGRYKGRRIGMTGSVRGSGRDGEHFEISMPENVRQLLEPYRRKVI